MVAWDVIVLFFYIYPYIYLKVTFMCDGIFWLLYIYIWRILAFTRFPPTKCIIIFLQCAQSNSLYAPFNPITTHSSAQRGEFHVMSELHEKKPNSARSPWAALDDRGFTANLPSIMQHQSCINRSKPHLPTALVSVYSPFKFQRGWRTPTPLLSLLMLHGGAPTAASSLLSPLSSPFSKFSTQIPPNRALLLYSPLSLSFSLFVVSVCRRRALHSASPLLSSAPVTLSFFDLNQFVLLHFFLLPLWGLRLYQSAGLLKNPLRKNRRQMNTN